MSTAVIPAVTVQDSDRRRALLDGLLGCWAVRAHKRSAIAFKGPNPRPLTCARSTARWEAASTEAKRCTAT